MFFLLAALLGCGGCGRVYHLAGHNDDNRLAPPDVTMRVGERREVLSNGINVKAMSPAEIRSDHSEIVAIEMPDADHAFIRAISAGVAHVYYLPLSPNNRGFQVTVNPSN